MQDLTGATLKSYQISDIIGMGAFGAVYRAHQAVIEREVAVKIIWPAFANHPNFIRRFEAEAQMVAGLEHPHIVPLYDYWRDPDGAYIVMRWLRGGALREVMDGSPWKLEDVTRLLGQIAAALTFAHRVNVIHRDIKPENILLDEEGNAYLADFGIAQIVSAAQEEGDEFGSMGSPAYAAPEQVMGQITDIRTDIFSLAVVVYELLAGQHPFPDLAEMSHTQMMNVRTTKPLPLLYPIRPDLPLAVDTVLQKATAFLPEDRYPDTLSFARAFREAIENGRKRSSQTSLRVTAIDTEVIPNPYKGLRAFQEADSSNFFGREELTERLLQRLQEPHALKRFLAVVGPSGSGKSSVVKAGLIPRLRRGGMTGSQNWFYTEIVPSSQPFNELETAILSVAANPPADWRETLRRNELGFVEIINMILPPNSEFFLFIDQFEELFTLSESELQSMRFLDSLYTAVTAPISRVRVVITLRADFYDRPLKRPYISALMRERTEVVIPLTPQELELAIVEPANQVGVEIESALVNQIITEINEQPGALPLLQYTLSELFEHRLGSVIPHEVYKAIGGVRGSLARRADELYQQFDPPQQEITRQLFLRLVTLGEGTEDTRRRALLTETTSMRGNRNVIRSVIDQLGRSRLLTFDRDPISRNPTIEITHEAIIREWQRLRDWLDESRNDVRMQRGLAGLASEWNANKKDASYLLRGIRLEQYQRWIEHTNISLNEEEQTFLSASIAEKTRVDADEKARQQREEALERRSLNRLRLVVVVLAAAVVVAVGLTLLALSQSQSAERARQRAEESLDLSVSTTQGVRAVQAFDEGNSDLAVVLALAANTIPDPSIETRRTLAEVAFAPGTRLILEGHTAFVSSVDISTDGNYVVSGSSDFSIILWDARTGALIRRFEAGHRGDVQSVAFSPDNTRVVSTGLDFQTIIWDVATGTIIRSLAGHQDIATSAAFSPDGRMILSGSKDTLLILWDAETGQEIRRLEGHTSRIRNIAFTPDGTRVLTAAREAFVWDLATGQIIHRLELPTAIRAMALTPDGKMAVSGATDGSLTVWNIETGEILNQFAQNLEIDALEFFPDGQTFVLGAETGEVELWEIGAGEVFQRLSGHSDAVLNVAISADGKQIVSASKDQTLRLWNVTPPTKLQTWVAHDNRITSVHIVDTWLYSTSLDGTVKVWDFATGQSIAIPVEGGAPITTLALNADETLLLAATGGEVSKIYLYHAESGLLLREYAGHAREIRSVAFSPDGQTFLSGAEDGELILWNIQTGAIIRQFNGEVGSLRSLAFTPDGQIVVVAGLDGLIEWDMQTGAVMQTIPTQGLAFYSVAISPDGQTIASATSDDSVILWDVQTGAERVRLSGHTDSVFSVVFSPDGRIVASSSSDNFIILWDAETGGELQRFEAETTPYSLTFDKTGKHLLAGDAAGKITHWRYFRLSELITWTQQNRYLRELTCGEREFYRVSPLCSE